jgi:hypothetical protein
VCTEGIHFYQIIALIVIYSAPNIVLVHSKQ